MWVCENSSSCVWRRQQTWVCVNTAVDMNVCQDSRCECVKKAADINVNHVFKKLSWREQSGMIFLVPVDHFKLRNLSWCFVTLSLQSAAKVCLWIGYAAYYLSIGERLLCCMSTARSESPPLPTAPMGHQQPRKCTRMTASFTPHLVESSAKRQGLSVSTGDHVFIVVFVSYQSVQLSFATLALCLWLCMELFPLGWTVSIWWCT